jgi:hypothetical protein
MLLCLHVCIFLYKLALLTHYYIFHHIIQLHWLRQGSSGRGGFGQGRISNGIFCSGTEHFVGKLCCHFGGAPIGNLGQARNGRDEYDG